MKISFLLMLIAVFGCAKPSQAQINQDSLWGIWSDETQSVVNRLEALKSMGQDRDGITTITANPDTIYYHAHLMYELAQANGLRKWMGEALIKQGISSFFKNDFAKALEFFNQSLTIGKEIEDKELIADNLFKMGACYLKLKDFTNGLPAFTRASEIYRELGEKRWEALSLDRIAAMYMFVKDGKTSEDVKTTIEYLEKSLAIRDELIKVDDNPKDRFVINSMTQTIKDLKAQLKNNTQTTNPNIPDSKDNNVELLPFNDPIYFESLGNEALKKGDNGKALEYFYDGLKKSEALDNKNLIATNLFNIGNQ